MTSHQSPSSRGLKSGMSNNINQTEIDVLWEEDHEETSSCSDESIDCD
jgi:hypothetical protein